MQLEVVVTNTEDEITLHECSHGTFGCKHEWVLPDGISEEENQNQEWPQEYCKKCGMSLMGHAFMEAP